MNKFTVMRKRSLDWLECSLFLMIANSEITDYYLTEEEITAIIAKAEELNSKFAFDGKSFTSDELMQKFNTAFEWYNTIGEAAPNGKMNAHIMQEINDIASYLKKQKWFSKDFAQILLDDLVEIAKVDGELIKNEKYIINTIAKEWKLAKPFS